MKTTPEYSEGQQAYRDRKLPEDNSYNEPMGLSVAGRTPEQREWDQKACDWYKGFVDAYAEWAEGKQDESD